MREGKRDLKEADTAESAPILKKKIFMLSGLGGMLGNENTGRPKPEGF